MKNIITYDKFLYESSRYNSSDRFQLERAKKLAADISKKEGVVYHVNKTNSGGYIIVDWYDENETVASYSHGKPIKESINFKEMLESVNESKKDLEYAKKIAKEISKKEGVIQHVNKTKRGGYRVEDWYDSDNTVASYNNGYDVSESSQFNESYSAKYFVVNNNKVVFAYPDSKGKLNKEDLLDDASSYRYNLTIYKSEQDMKKDLNKVDSKVEILDFFDKFYK